MDLDDVAKVRRTITIRAMKMAADGGPWTVELEPGEFVVSVGADLISGLIYIGKWGSTA